MDHLQERLEKRLAALVALPTVQSQTEINLAAISGIGTELASYGMRTHVEPGESPWLIATTRATKHPKVLLAAHLDVVDPNSPDQHTMRIADGKIIGRGVFDMKFAIACYVELIRQLNIKNALADYDLGILITTDEEKGGYQGVKHFLEQGWAADVVVLPDGGRDWKLELKAKGIIYLYLEAYGAATHSSRPWEGENASHKLIPALHDIMTSFPNRNPEQATVSINTVETTGVGRINTTQVPNHGKAGIDIRAYTTAEMNAAVEKIKQIAARHGLEMHITLNEQPVALMADHPLVQEFISSLSTVLGQPVEYTSSLGASDARHFAAKNLPTVLLYPHGGGAHSADEWMAQKDLPVFYNVIDHYINQTAKIRPLGTKADASH